MRSNMEYICDNLDLTSISETERFPIYVQIETTARCNSRCLMCPRSKELPRRKTLDMSKALMDKLLKELACYSGHIRRVVPQGYGEPFLDPNLPYFIRELKDIGIKEVFISSNASVLNEELSHSVIESGLDQIDFSLDAFTEGTYERIRKGLHYDTVLRNIENFIRIRDESNSKTSIRFRYVIQETNEHEFDDFCRYWSRQLRGGDIVYGKKIHTFGGSIEMPQLEEYRELQKEMLSRPCKGIFGSLVILSDGSVPICGVDVNQKHIAGDANVALLKDIWRGGLFGEFRRRHLEQGQASYLHCSACNSWAPELKVTPT